MFVNVNGCLCEEEEAKVYAKDRGFLLGDGLFETIRIEEGKPLYLNAHWERLIQSADKLSFTLPLTAPVFKKSIEELIERNTLMNAGLRLTVTRGVGERALVPKRVRDGIFFLYSFDLVRQQTPVRLTYSPIIRNETSPITGLKTLSYLENVMIKEDAEARGFDDALCLNTKGVLTETSCANFFLIKENKIMTPPSRDGLLPGIMRAQIASYCERNGLAFQKVSVYPSDITERCSAFITNSLIGVRPVSQIDDMMMATHSVVEKLSKRFYS